MGTKEDRLNDFLVENRQFIPTLDIRKGWKIGQTCDQDWVCIDCLDEYNETERGDGPWGHIDPDNPDHFMKILPNEAVDEYPKCCKCNKVFTYMKLEGA